MSIFKRSPARPVVTANQLHAIIAKTMERAGATLDRDNGQIIIADHQYVVITEHEARAAVNAHNVRPYKVDVNDCDDTARLAWAHIAGQQRLGKFGKDAPAAFGVVLTQTHCLNLFLEQDTGAIWLVENDGRVLAPGQLKGKQNIRLVWI